MTREYKKRKMAALAPDKLWLTLPSLTRSIYHRIFWGHCVKKVDRLIEPFLSSPTPPLEMQFVNHTEAPMNKCAICKNLDTDQLIGTTSSGKKVFHQPNYIALVISATEGCKICNFFLSSVLEFDSHGKSRREVYQLIRGCKSKMEIWANP
jgi:hypothetical protein